MFPTRVLHGLHKQVKRCEMRGSLCYVNPSPPTSTICHSFTLIGDNFVTIPQNLFPSVLSTGGLFIHYCRHYNPFLYEYMDLSF